MQVAEGVPVAQGGVPVPVEDYAYDGEGNRTASHLSAMYSSNGHNQLLEDDSYSYAYDAKGNRISRTAKAGGAVEDYAYDSQNRLVGYASPTTTARYAYDALERRIAKSVGGVTEAYVYDGSDLSDPTAQNVTLVQKAGPPIRRWLFGPQTDEPLAFEEYSGATAAGSGSVTELFANRLGSIVTAVAVYTGVVAVDYDYDAYGTRTQVGTLEQPYGYTGREHDAESGLIHLRARAYDPRTGVFLQEDPIGFASRQANLYSYTAGNPINATDPGGLTSFMENRYLSDASMQGLGAASTAASEGVLSLSVTIAEALMNSSHAGHSLSLQSLPGLAPPDGTGSNHCNAKSNQIGNHVYMIYTRADGIPRKVGIANNKRLTDDGFHSRRALEQIAALGKNATKFNHVVLLKTPDGFYSRLFALALEQALTNYVKAFFGDVLDPDLQKKPEPKDICP